MLKTCSTCREAKPLTAFVKSPVHRDGYHGVCKPCRNAQRKAKGRTETPEQQRRWNLKGQYGISIEDYDAMLAKQDGLCAICGTPADESTHGKLHVDHCHATGKVRGLLCSACNPALGLFRDEIERLQAAIRYLEETA